MSTHLHFITGSRNKFQEVALLLPGLQQLDRDLPEMQSLDPREIIQAKLEAALAHHPGPFLVEDTGLYLDCLNGFPGPLVKWFWKSVGMEKIVQLTQVLGNDRATVKTVVGYAETADLVHFFEGTLSGRIVSPRGEDGFGWDPVFLPDGFEKTLGQMTREEKNELSYRKIAVMKLKEYLEKQ